MQIRHSLRLGLIWLLLSILLAVFMFTASQAVLENAVREQVRQHLLLTLDEAHFGTAQEGGNDLEALQRIGQQINRVLEGLVVNRWYSPRNECVVRLRQIDGVAIHDQPMEKNIAFNLPRNQIEREIVVGLSCSPNWLAVFAAGGFLGMLFLGINFFVPPPLSSAQRQWSNYLLERGYSAAEAFEILCRFEPSRLALSPAQLACIERLHDGKKRNFADVLDLATDARVAALGADQIDWLILGLQRDPHNLTAALDLVAAEDVVVIDLKAMTLSIRGLQVPMSGTPLFYYAWYAMSRLRGDGWITNPASNRPDTVLARELIDLMSGFDGHAKAIRDLERTGLRAKTLDQNRSKIKDDMVSALGKKLAAAYLFDASKHQNGIHMRYRLHVDAHQIHLIT